MMIQNDAAVVHGNTIQFAPDGTVSYSQVYSRMFLWCESGKGDVKVNGIQFPMTKDRFLILPWRHSISYRADRINPYKLGGLHIIPHYSRAAPFRASVAHNSSQIWWENDLLCDRTIPGLDQIVCGDFSSEMGLKLLAVYIIELFHGERINRKTAGAAAVLFLDEIQCFLNSPGEDNSRSDSERFERITRFIRDNLSLEIRLEQLCDRGAVSRSTLRRLFLKSTGVPPYEWIIQTRLERARFLLKTTSEPISQISQQTGFEDSSYFVRLFHKRTGVTPGEFRSEACKL